MKMDEDTRSLIRARAKQRYRESPEEHRMKRYLHALNKGAIRCPKESTLKRHCVQPTEDGTWTCAVST